MHVWLTILANTWPILAFLYVIGWNESDLTGIIIMVWYRGKNAIEGNKTQQN